MEQNTVTCKRPELELDVGAEPSDVEAGERDPGLSAVECRHREVVGFQSLITPRPRPQWRTVTGECPVMLLARAPGTTRVTTTGGDTCLWILFANVTRAGEISRPTLARAPHTQGPGAATLRVIITASGPPGLGHSVRHLPVLGARPAASRPLHSATGTDVTFVAGVAWSADTLARHLVTLEVPGPRHRAQTRLTRHGSADANHPPVARGTESLSGEDLTPPATSHTANSAWGGEKMLNTAVAC